MPLNRTFFHVDVSETDHDRNYWATQAGLNPDTVAAVRNADILLVPWENRGKDGLTFPFGTADFFQSIRQRFPDGKTVIAINPDQYAELSLHANETRWPTLVVSTLVLGTLTNILSDQIERAISTPAPPTIIEMQVIVENERGKCISVEYKGPPDRLVDTLLKETERCLPPKAPK